MALHKMTRRWRAAVLCVLMIGTSFGSAYCGSISYRLAQGDPADRQAIAMAVNTSPLAQTRTSKVAKTLPMELGGRLWKVPTTYFRQFTKNPRGFILTMWWNQEKGFASPKRQIAKNSTFIFVDVREHEPVVGRSESKPPAYALELGHKFPFFANATPPNVTYMGSFDAYHHRFDVKMGGGSSYVDCIARHTEKARLDQIEGKLTCVTSVQLSPTVSAWIKIRSITVGELGLILPKIILKISTLRH